MIIIAAITDNPCIVLFITNRTNAVTTSILSAIGSSNSPNLVCCFKSRARKPSMKSVKLAKTKIPHVSQSPNFPGK